MGWGNARPFAELKRRHAADRAAAARVDSVQARLDCVARLIAHFPDHVPTPLLALALTDPSRCSFCLSAYTACWVHG